MSIKRKATAKNERQPMKYCSECEHNGHMFCCGRCSAPKVKPRGRKR